MIRFDEAIGANSFRMSCKHFATMLARRLKDSKQRQLFLFDDENEEISAMFEFQNEMLIAQHQL